MQFGELATVAEIWRTISADTTAIDDGLFPEMLVSKPIWNSREEIPTNAHTLWNSLSSHLLAANEGWEVWTEWYKDRWRGRPINSQLELARVLEVTEEDWINGPAFANAKIAEIIGRFESSTKQDQEDVWVDFEPPLPTIKGFIVQLLDKTPHPLSVSEIVEHFSNAGYTSPRESIRGRLNTLTNEGRILRVARGFYASIDYDSSELEDLEPKEDRPPEIPKQEDGLTFGVSPNGKIGFVHSGRISDDDDVAQIEALREVVVQALDDLLAAAEGSNALPTLGPVAQRYRAVLVGEISTISIDQLYAQGVRLDNTCARLREEIARGDLPDVNPNVGEALDSVIAIHGPMVLSTRRGRQLLELSRQYNATRDEELAYEERARAFVEAIVESDGLVDSDVKEVIEPLNAEFGEGRFPERSSDVARRANRNLIVAVTSLVLPVAGPIVAAGFLASQPGMAVSAITAELINAASLFLQAHAQELRMLAAVAGQELSWLTAFLDWFERKRSR